MVIRAKFGFRGTIYSSNASKGEKMNYKNKKLIKQIGIIFLAAAVMMVLPSVLVSSVMNILQLAITIAMLWMLYRILMPIIGPIYRDYRYRSRRSSGGDRRPPNWYSDRR